MFVGPWWQMSSVSQGRPWLELDGRLCISGAAHGGSLLAQVRTCTVARVRGLVQNTLRKGGLRGCLLWQVGRAVGGLGPGWGHGRQALLAAG